MGATPGGTLSHTMQPGQVLLLSKNKRSSQNGKRTRRFRRVLAPILSRACTRIFLPWPSIAPSVGQVYWLFPSEKFERGHNTDSHDNCHNNDRY